MDLINRSYKLGGLRGIFNYLFELLIAEMPKSKQQMFKPTLTTDYLGDESNPNLNLQCKVLE